MLHMRKVTLMINAVSEGAWKCVNDAEMQCTKEHTQKTQKTWLCLELNYALLIVTNTLSTGFFFNSFI